MTYEQMLTICTLLLAVSALLLSGVLVIARRRNAARDDQLKELARQIDRRLEARMSQLQDLVDQARVQVRELKKLDSFSATPVDSGVVQTQEQEVLRLYSMDMSLIEIARRLGLSVGEVELTLNLHKSQPAPQA